MIWSSDCQTVAEEVPAGLDCKTVAEGVPGPPPSISSGFAPVRTTIVFLLWGKEGLSCMMIQQDDEELRRDVGSCLQWITTEREFWVRI